MEVTGAYLIAVFGIIFLSGCVVNLLKYHYIIQLSGIGFFILFYIFRSYALVNSAGASGWIDLYYLSLPALTGIAACLFSMILGFWIFPSIREKFKS